MNNNSNPLLNFTELPVFNQIRAEHINPAVDFILQESQQKLSDCLQNSNINNLTESILLVEELLDRISTVWSQVSHLNAVRNSDDFREQYEKAQTKITDYYTKLNHNKDLYDIYNKFLHQDELFNNAPYSLQKLVKNALRDFRLAGITLSDDLKQKYSKLNQELSDLAIKFENNVLDCIDNWKLLVKQDDISQLEGLPEYLLDKFKTIYGFEFDLKAPTYIEVMKNAKNQQLRKKFYDAYITVASDLGQHEKKYNNIQIMYDILAKRQEVADLLGFENYAEKSLATKMADSYEEVTDFLWDLVRKVKKTGQAEFAELQKFALKKDNIKNLEPWDIAYYSEKLKEEKFYINDEMLREYFPLYKVLSGLFTIVNKLYGITVQETPNDKVWDKQVKFYSIYDRDNNLRGQFYLDLFARNKKRGGAWMDECRTRKKLHDNDKLQIPIAYLTCNFMPPQENNEPLLTHDEVLTLFHEFGHGLHHMLSIIDYPEVSGINGVPWDGVELPSQFLENWCWQKESLELIAEHYQTKSPLPDDMLEKLLQAKNFQSSMFLLRQLEFALFDFILHENFELELGVEQIYAILDYVRGQVAVVPIVEYNRFANSFQHIFAGGYAAGYYSYLWAEVLSSDAFAKFLEKGIFNQCVGREFLQNILEQGGSQDFMKLFIAFRGRKPESKAFLLERGIIES